MILRDSRSYVILYSTHVRPIFFNPVIYITHGSNSYFPLTDATSLRSESLSLYPRKGLYQVLHERRLLFLSLFNPNFTSLSNSMVIHSNWEIKKDPLVRVILIIIRFEINSVCLNLKVCMLFFIAYPMITS